MGSLWGEHSRQKQEHLGGSGDRSELGMSEEQQESSVAGAQ